MEQKSQLWIGTLAAAILGAVVIAVAARAPEIVPKETQALADEAAAEKAAADAAKDDKAKAAEASPAKPLAEKLDESSGVLKPPQGIDPEIRKPPPVGGSMKVIVPPGSPGGDPSVVPQ